MIVPGFQRKLNIINNYIDKLMPQTKTNTKALAKPIDQDILDQLKDSQPMEETFQRIQFPRLGMYSQDVTEESTNPKTKKKEITVIAEAGMFYIEKETEEVDEDGKKKWERTEIGNTIEATILYNRKQLKYYDANTEKFTSSPIYDTEDEIIPLFSDKQEVAKDTPAELKKLYQYVDPADGKTKSNLKDNRILYVLYEGEVYQMNLGGSSMFAFMKYNREVKPVISAVLTNFFSEAKVKGKIAWNQMVFTKTRDLQSEEAMAVLEQVNIIKDSINSEKSFCSRKNPIQAERVKDGEEDLDDVHMALEAGKSF